MDDLSEVFAAFMDFYQPADCVKESDDLLSTHEITLQIDELLGSDQEEALVFKYLKENGFKYKFTTEGFRWLMKIKTNPSV